MKMAPLVQLVEVASGKKEEEICEARGVRRISVLMHVARISGCAVFNVEEYS